MALGAPRRCSRGPEGVPSSSRSSQEAGPRRSHCGSRIPTAASGDQAAASGSASGGASAEPPEGPVSHCGCSTVRLRAASQGPRKARLVCGTGQGSHPPRSGNRREVPAGRAAPVMGPGAPSAEGWQHSVSSARARLSPRPPPWLSHIPNALTLTLTLHSHILPRTHYCTLTHTHTTATHIHTTAHSHSHTIAHSHTLLHTQTYTLLHAHTHASTHACAHTPHQGRAWGRTMLLSPSLLLGGRGYPGNGKRPAQGASGPGDEASASPRPPLRLRSPHVHC